MNSPVPVIDISPLISNTAPQEVAEQLRTACTQYGFFYITGHGVSEALQQRLEQESQAFFILPEDEKMKIRMAMGGKAWRGYFRVGDELTSGKPDLKEGLYLGTELDDKDNRVQMRLPMHGANLFPPQIPTFRQTVLEYLDALTQLGHHLMRGLSLSLELEASYFNQHFTSDPLCLFRIFHYPAAHTKPESKWGVGEHTDYGVLTILKQDKVGGLQVKSKEQWLNAPYIPNSFVCNIGDMLERLTGGYYISTPHRVKNESGKSRYSFPFFFDPNFDAQIKSIDLTHLNHTHTSSYKRWDGANVHEFQGTYGDYILGKVAKVFPELKKDVEG